MTAAFESCPGFPVYSGRSRASKSGAENSKVMKEYHARPNLPLRASRFSGAPQRGIESRGDGTGRRRLGWAQLRAKSQSEQLSRKREGNRTSMKAEALWCARRDSNAGPFAPEANALSRLSYGRKPYDAK